jgi:hypothetical protein
VRSRDPKVRSLQLTGSHAAKIGLLARERDNKLKVKKYEQHKGRGPKKLNLRTTMRKDRWSARNGKSLIGTIPQR